MDEINILDLDHHERLHIEQDGEITYSLHYDKYTGDWGVVSEQEMHGVDYYRDKQSALNAALSMAGVLENPDVDHAPDRC